MALNKEKYINALVFLVSNCGNKKLGIVKLNKLFYYLDFISFRDRGHSVTGEIYKRLPMGPFAPHLQDKIIKLAEKEKFIKSIEDESSKFGKRNHYEALKSFNADIFDEYEKNLLEYICLNFKDWTTDQMIAQTHSEAPWVFSKDNQDIDYKNSDDIEFFKDALKHA